VTLVPGSQLGAYDILSLIGCPTWPSDRPWDSDGIHIFFRRNRSDMPKDASRNYLLTQTLPGTRKTGSDIWVLPLFHTPSQERSPRLSPDGDWLAYQSDASTRWEIYVDSFPQPGDRHTISTNGGQVPVWSRNGSQLYYYSLDNEIMAVSVTPGGHFQYGAPTPLLQVRIPTANTSFEMSREGRFLLPALVEQGSTPLTVVLNWPEILKRK
jgi:hypothetical protein